MGTENKPGIFAKIALRLEESIAARPSVQRADVLSRRSFLELGYSQASKYAPAAIVFSLGGLALVSGVVYLDKLLAGDDQIRLSLQMQKEIQTLPSGEKVFFWPSKVSVGPDQAKVRFGNGTSNLIMALYPEGFEKFLREERISLKNIGLLELWVTQGKQETIFGANRRVTISIADRGQFEQDQLMFQEASHNISSEIGAILSLAQKSRYWDTAALFQELVKERNRISEKMRNQKVPPFSLWRQKPDSY